MELKRQRLSWALQANSCLGLACALEDVASAVHLSWREFGEQLLFEISALMGLKGWLSG